MPGNKYEFLSVIGMTVSMSNSVAVRVKAKHHSNVREIIFFLMNSSFDNICSSLVLDPLEWGNPVQLMCVTGSSVEAKSLPKFTLVINEFLTILSKSNF